MKTKYIITIFIIGCIILIIGSMFKIMHWPLAGTLIITATGIQAIAALIAIWKVLTTDKFKDFLNS